ncbi:MULTISPECIES: outer membrane lipoprotein chaperone LolA [Pseudoalteromonas]|jgi:outer membrane lipoprotein carrier protein|uniref:Outer-membrane lipoprotein carrier protein n=2 Tax=Pseudoalteromonas agarivorans TaxID=176102 RepID=A0AAD0XCS3_9GAMM|nr:MULTISPECIES: outer membrane lipoprotein chaperone LolA [Pseudoalteromonas]MCP4061398.1 outer membrane lipoprotein chaperone LolA [Pseudoalteromonas sp.]MDY6886985.1 outer membrane lipoprotein chaperone LolA [Pseudomonadota bacterium]ATC82129.1 outer membrane lipoprotein carrier protein [Pseudoalteromonas agarivorans DSM 14585]AYM86800.1 outer membrane lipoprotein carrier protein LolA [Pseudoalteromonas agarivorans]ENN99982.1 molecular chaperone [Pseudoalteromonas agarivorans S816]|tara:strand:- start:68 stop:694 length:627 start_codon:yes stop_codon:yes gene_type:complete
MKKLNSLLLVLGSLIATPSFADDSQALQDKLATLKSFKAQFSQNVTDPQGQAVMQGEGTIALKQPMMIRWQQTNPDDTLFVSNGDKTYYFDSFAEQVTIMDTHSLIDSTPFVLLTSKDPAQWEKYSVQATDSGFSVTPNKGVESQVEQLDITFAGNEQGLAKLVVTDNSGQLSSFSFNNAQVNTALDTSTFEFTPPEGVEIDDQSNGE